MPCEVNGSNVACSAGKYEPTTSPQLKMVIAPIVIAVLDFMVLPCVALVVAFVSNFDGRE